MVSISSATLAKQPRLICFWDQRAIWTSPLHLQGDDAKWLVPLGLSTAAPIASDRRTAGALHNDRLRLNISRDVAYLGSAGGASSIAGAFYLIGRATNNARARETGLLGGEALIDSGIVSGVISMSPNDDAHALKSLVTSSREDFRFRRDIRQRPGRWRLS